MPTTPPASLLIRPATPADAAAAIEHTTRAIEEFPGNLSFNPGEFDYTLDYEQKLFADVAASDNSLFLLALVDNQIVAVLNYTGGKRQAVRHTAILGISVRKAWCNRGIGTALMQAAIAHARSRGVIKRLELAVYAHNQRAIHVYENLGFVREGRRKNAVLKNGRYLDDLIMALLLE